MYKIKLFIILLLYAVVNFNATAQENKVNNDAQEALSNIDKQFFIENKGQWPSEVLYLTQMGGLNTWITTKGMMYEFYKTEEIKPTATTDVMPNKLEHLDYNQWGHRVAYKLLGNNIVVKTQGKQKQEGYYNYLIGNDPNKYASNVGLYKEALVKDVYTGIDMRYYFDKGLLRYDYIVHPGADPNQIHFSIDGSDKTYINEKGELVFTTSFGEVKNADLYCYQQKDKTPVNAKFIKSSRLEGRQGESWKVELGTYDKNQTLIIDPLIYSTYIGGSNDEWGISITLDAFENTYITGRTSSPNYDISIGAFQTTIIGGSVWDVFVTKLNAFGTALIYSTFIGGNNTDYGRSIAIDDSGNAYITGHTQSKNFPITSGAFQTTTIGGSISDVFVTKLNAFGTALIYSTYIGGSNNEHVFSIALDTSGNTYITGYTQSTDYETTVGAFQTIHEGGMFDAFVTKLNAFGTALIYSTFIGGSNNDFGNSITIDSFGDAYITGFTQSPDYDITIGAFQTTFAGGTYDVFVTKLNATGTALIYSTYIGGSGSDQGISIAVDSSGNTFITGYTDSPNYNITLGAFQTTFAGGTYDVFVTKLNATGTALIYSTYIGGSSEDYSQSIAIDSSGNACITGRTQSSDYDITTGAFQTTFAGGTYDVFVTKLNATGTALIYSTYIGGSSVDWGFSIALDASGFAYITGFTQSSDYDITIGAFQTTNAGGYDVFVTKIGLYPCIQTTGTDIVTACDSLTWIDGITYTSSTFTPTFTLTNAVGCDSMVTLNLTINTSTSYTDVIVACDSLTWIDENTYTSSISTPTFVLTNAVGCDSVVTLNLTINTSTSYTDVIVACDSLTWIDGNTYSTNTNTPTFILTNAAGCDSVVTLNLTINNPNSSTDIVTACDSITWIDGNTYTTNTNTPIFTLTNAAGCDSVVTLNLTINNPNSSTDIVTACDSITWIDGNTYTTNTNTPIFTLTNAAGCDSVVTLNLTINNSNAGTDVQTACNSFTWLDNITYTSSTNTSTFTIPSGAVNGCDSVVTLDLTITTLDNTTSLNTNTISANQNGATYRWLNCDSNNVVIAGATAQSFTPTATGNYAVELTVGSCVDTSACVNVIITGIEELTPTGIKIYPNPFDDNIVIEFKNSTQNTQVTVVNIEGKVVYSNAAVNSNKLIIDAAAWSKGVYSIQILNNNETITKKIIKQ